MVALGGGGSGKSRPFLTANPGFLSFTPAPRVGIVISKLSSANFNIYNIFQHMFHVFRYIYNITQHLSIYHFHKHKLKFSKKILQNVVQIFSFILIFITHVHRSHLKWLSPRYSQCCYFGKSTLAYFNIFQRLLKMDQS